MENKKSKPPFTYHGNHGSLTEEISRILDRRSSPDNPQSATLPIEWGPLRIRSTVRPAEAEAFFDRHFGSVIVRDPSGNRWNDLMFIIHGEEDPPTEDCLKNFGASVLNNAAKRRVKKFMVVSGPYNPEPQRHRRAMKGLYDGVSSMMKRPTPHEPVFQGIVVPSSPQYESYGRSSLMLFNVKAKAEAVSHKVSQAFSSGESYRNDVSFVLGKPLDNTDPNDKGLQEALAKIGLDDLAMLILVKRYLRKVAKYAPRIQESTYLREGDIDELLL